MDLRPTDSVGSNKMVRRSLFQTGVDSSVSPDGSAAVDEVNGSVLDGSKHLHGSPATKSRRVQSSPETITKAVAQGRMLSNGSLLKEESGEPLTGFTQESVFEERSAPAFSPCSSSSSSSSASSNDNEDKDEYENCLTSKPSATSSSPLKLSPHRGFVRPIKHVGWARLGAADGDGNLMRHIVGFFIADLIPEDLKGVCPLELRALRHRGGEAPFALSTAMKDPLSHADLLDASGACRLLAQAVDSVLSALLVSPGGGATCKPLPYAGDCGVALSEMAPYHSLTTTRPGLGVFTAEPERRVRAYTACDDRGRDALDGLYGNPVFCVRFRGIRRGATLFPAANTADFRGWNSGPRAPGDTGGVGNWPLQLHTYFKMRTYTKFERLMGVYAGRSHLPLPWLNFEVTDRLYGIPTAAQTTANASERPLPPQLALKTNNGRKPLLPFGGRIRPSHSLWTLGIEPGNGGLDENESVAPTEAPELGGGGGEEALREGDAGTGTTEAVAAAAAAEEEAEEEEEDGEEGDVGPAVEDVWVDSYLTCAEDECFVCVRDRREGCEDVERTPTAMLPRFGGNGLEHAALGTEGALVGDNALSGPFGAAGRFGAGDAGSDLPSLTHEDDPGQPVRPPFPGWLFRLKVTEPIRPALKRILNEIDLAAASAAARERAAERLTRRVAAATAAASPSPAIDSTPTPFSPRFSPPISSAPETAVEASDLSSMSGSSDEEPAHVIASSLLRFTAVASIGLFGGGRELRVPLDHLHATDTAVDATTRAALGTDFVGSCSATPKWVVETPMHIIELCDLGSYGQIDQR